MTTRQLIQLIDGYLRDGSVDPDKPIKIQLWAGGDEYSHGILPATMASGHVTKKELTIWARIKGKRKTKGSPKCTRATTPT